MRTSGPIALQLSLPVLQWVGEQGAALQAIDSALSLPRLPASLGLPSASVDQEFISGQGFLK